MIQHPVRVVVASSPFLPVLSFAGLRERFYRPKRDMCVCVCVCVCKRCRRARVTHRTLTLEWRIRRKGLVPPRPSAREISRRFYERNVNVLK